MNLKQDFKSAVIKSVTGKYFLYVVQVVSLAICARLFSPEDYGVFASVSVFIIFFQMLSEMGIGPAILEKKNFKSKEIDGIFTVTLGLGLVISTAFYFFSFLLNGYYNSEIYPSLAIIIMPSIIFNTLNIIPVAALNQTRSFLTLSRNQCVGEVVSLLLIIFIYFKTNLGDVLFYKVSISSFIVFFLNYFSSKKTEIGKPRFGRSISSIKIVISFSLNQFGFNFINYFSRNFDNILIGKFFSMQSLGVYDKAYSLMRYPLYLLTYAFSPAIQPVIREHRNNLEEIECFHRAFTNKLMWMGTIFSIIIYAMNEEIVWLLLGQGWEGVADLIQIFSLIIPIQVVLSSSGGFYQGLGRADLLLHCGFFSAVTNITAIILGVISEDMNNIAIFFCLSTLINFFQCYYYMYRKIFLKYDYIAFMFPSFLKITYLALTVMIMEMIDFYFPVVVIDIKFKIAMVTLILLITLSLSLSTMRKLRG